MTILSPKLISEKKKKKTERGGWTCCPRQEREIARRDRAQHHSTSMEFTDRCDLAPARDRGQQRGQKEGGLRTWEVGFSKWFLRLKIFDFLFFSSLLVCRTRRSHVGAASAHVEKKKKKRTLAGHRNPMSRTCSDVRHVSDINTTPKIACPCNLGWRTHVAHHLVQSNFFFFFLGWSYPFLLTTN